MTFEERTDLFNRIVSGITVIDYKGTVYFVHDPTPAEHIRVEAVARNVYNKLLLSGVPTEAECEAILLERGLWLQENEIKLQELGDNLKKLRRGLPDLEFKSNEKKQVLGYIDFTENAIKELHRIKTTLSSTSAEYITRLYKYKLLLRYLTKDENNELMWPTAASFKSVDDSLINHLLTKSYFNDLLDDKKIRELARSEPWRSTWLGAVKTGNLFGAPLAHLTDYQRTLVSWSILYDNVYEHPEAPAQEVIDNDVLLDSWLEIQADKRKHRDAVGADTFLSNDKIRNSKEVGIIVDSYEDAKKVYNLNSGTSKDILAKRSKSIREKGEIKELDLPDVRRDFNMEKNRLGISGVKQRMAGG